MCSVLCLPPRKKLLKGKEELSKGSEAITEVLQGVKENFRAKRGVATKAEVHQDVGGRRAEDLESSRVEHVRSRSPV